MKASILYTITLCSITTLSISQNYQTVQSHETHFFATQNYDYVLASKVTATQLQGTDSVFTSFQTIRENPALAQNDPCKYFVGCSWMGPQMVMKPNGQNIFYNQNDESITIETQAVLNDTFLVYTYPSGDWIKGVVDNVVQLSIFGEMDSVKIIDLISNVPLELENPRFILSKNHGFVELFVPYTFPNPYQGAASVSGDNSYPLNYTGNYTLVGIDTSGFSKPTVADVYNHAIGDEYKFLSSVTSDDGTTEIYTEKKIINKFVWPDSLAYFVQETNQKIHYPPSGPAQHYTYGGELEVNSYTNLEEWNTPYLPEEFNGSDGWTVLLINSCNDVEEVTRKEPYYWDGVNACLVVDPTASSLQFTTVSGVGWLAKEGASSNNAESFTAEMVYYQKADGSSCGTNQFLEVEEKDAQVMSAAYPNPTAGMLWIDMPAGESDPIVTVVDKSGRIVRVWKSAEEYDMTELNPGLYTLLIQNHEEVRQEQVVRM